MTLCWELQRHEALKRGMIDKCSLHTQLNEDFPWNINFACLIAIHAEGYLTMIFRKWCMPFVSVFWQNTNLHGIDYVSPSLIRLNHAHQAAFVSIRFVVYTSTSGPRCAELRKCEDCAVPGLGGFCNKRRAFVRSTAKLHAGKTQADIWDPRAPSDGTRRQKNRLQGCFRREKNRPVMWMTNRSSLATRTSDTQLEKKLKWQWGYARYTYTWQYSNDMRYKDITRAEQHCDAYF